MSARWLSAVLLAALATAADPTLALSTASLPYDLNSGGISMPLGWGPVALDLGAPSAQVRIQAVFSRPAGSTTIAAATSDDLLTVRSGWRVEVDGPGTLLVDGQAWTWSGPIHGDGRNTTAAPLWLESRQPVTAANALLALRQVCYANLAGPRVLTKRRAELRLAIVGSAATPASDLIELLPGTTAIPPLLRFEPVQLHPGIDAISAIADTACWSGAALSVARSAGDDLGPAAAGVDPPDVVVTTDQDRPALRFGHATGNGAWQFAVSVSAAGVAGASLAVVPVEVSEAAANLQVAGALPLEIDLDADTLGSDLALPLVITKDNGDLAVAVAAHPALGTLDATQASALQGALAFQGTALHLDRSLLAQALAGAATFPRWLIVALDIHVDSEHRLVPWILHLVPPPPAG